MDFGTLCNPWAPASFNFSSANSAMARGVSAVGARGVLFILLSAEGTAALRLTAGWRTSVAHMGLVRQTAPPTLPPSCDGGDGGDGEGIVRLRSSKRAPPPTLRPRLTHGLPFSFSQILTTLDNADRCALLSVWSWQASMMSICPSDVRSLSKSRAHPFTLHSFPISHSSLAALVRSLSPPTFAQ